jgi:hypothetical protein
MDSNQKKAVVGSGLVAAGFGLGVVGAALIAPAVFDWAAGLINRRTDQLTTRMENASKTIGGVAGRLHRSFNAAKRAGAEEMRRGA